MGVLRPTVRPVKGRAWRWWGSSASGPPPEPWRWPCVRLGRTCLRRRELQWVPRRENTTGCGSYGCHHNLMGFLGRTRDGDGDDEGPDDGLETGGAAEGAEFRIRCVGAVADRTTDGDNFSVFGMRLESFHIQSPGHEARMREAMARASSHICAESVSVQTSHKSVAEL